MKNFIFRCFASIASIVFGASALASTSNISTEPLTPALTHEINEKTALGSDILQKYLGSKAAYTPSDVDAAIVAWRESNTANKETPDKMVDALGAYFGTYLVNQLKLQWMIYRDKQGSDLCVIDRRVFVYSFPHSVIYKAVIDGRRDALLEVESTLAKQISTALKNPKV